MTDQPKVAPQASASDNADKSVTSTTDAKPTITVAPATEKATVEPKKS